MASENELHRLVRIGRMIVTLNLSPLAYALWLRYHRLEFGKANYISPEDGNPHRYSGGPVLAKILRSLRIPKGSVALDLGVGMGIAAITLSRYFSSVIGVDLSPELIAVAKRNVVRMKVTNIELHCVDARAFTDSLDRVTHVYMFNPFDPPVMAVVMQNLRASLARTPRRLVIIYKNPLCHETVVTAGFAHRRDFHFRDSAPYAVYEA